MSKRAALPSIPCTGWIMDVAGFAIYEASAHRYLRVSSAARWMVSEWHRKQREICTGGALRPVS
jgi:hypothetical protein